MGHLYGLPGNALPSRTAVEPTGLWVTSSAANPTVHMIWYAEALWGLDSWTRRERFCIHARSLCGAAFGRPVFHSEPPEQLDLCDFCLLWDFDCNDGFMVYRLLNADARAVYVGFTRQPARRMFHHARLSPWWPEVAGVEFEMAATEEDARFAEKAAIHRYDPIYNRQRYMGFAAQAA